MKPTRIVSLLALFVAVAAVVWGALTLVDDRGGVLPRLAALKTIELEGIDGPVRIDRGARTKITAK